MELLRLDGLPLDFPPLPLLPFSGRLLLLAPLLPPFALLANVLVLGFAERRNLPANVLQKLYALLERGAWVLVVTGADQVALVCPDHFDPAIDLPFDSGRNLGVRVRIFGLGAFNELLLVLGYLVGVLPHGSLLDEVAALLAGSGEQSATVPVVDAVVVRVRP